LRRLEEEVQEHARQEAEKHAELEELRRQLAEKEAEIARLKAQIEEFEKQIKALEQRIQELEEKIRELEALIATLRQENIDQTDRDARRLQELDKQIQQLQDELTKEKDLVSKTQASGTETTNELVERVNQLEKQLLRKRAQITKLDDEMDSLLAESEKAKRKQLTGLKRIQDTIATNVQAQVALSTLAKMLEEKQYVQIRDAVRAGAAGSQRPKKQYTSTAVFLILESMGGTWCMYEKLVKDKKLDAATTTFSPETAKQIREYEQNLPVVLRQTLYDLTMWDSILNSPKKTRYMSHNVQKFIDAYDLDNNEPTDSLHESSDDVSLLLSSFF